MGTNCNREIIYIKRNKTQNLSWKSINYSNFTCLVSFLSRQVLSRAMTIFLIFLFRENWTKIGHTFYQSKEEKLYHVQLFQTQPYFLKMPFVSQIFKQKVYQKFERISGSFFIMKSSIHSRINLIWDYPEEQQKIQENGSYLKSCRSSYSKWYKIVDWKSRLNFHVIVILMESCCTIWLFWFLLVDSKKDVW